MATRFKNLMLAGMLLALGACATQGSVLTAGVGAIRTSATAADGETEKVFGEINAVDRGDTIASLLANNERPSEKAFRPIIDPAAAAQWSAAFDGVDKYLAALQDLVDTKRSAAITENLKGVGTALQGPTFGAKVDDKIVGLFANLGGAIVQAAAEKKAQDIMRRTDPKFRALMNGLAGLVGQPGETAEPGTLRSMVDNHWSTQLGGVQAAYVGVLNAPEDARRPLLVKYGQLIDERQAYRDRLERLRRALVAIGEAHSAASKGSPGATFFWIGQINDFVKKARDDANAGGK